MAVSQSIKLREIPNLDPVNDNIEDWFKQFEKQCTMLEKTKDEEMIIEFEKYVPPIIRNWLAYCKVQDPAIKFERIKTLLIEDLPFLSYKLEHEEDITFENGDDILAYFYRKVSAIKNQIQKRRLIRLKQK